MASKSYIKGFPLSSTPVQSIEDGGYFGSGQRKNFYSSNAKVLTTCSPIKEFSFKILSNKTNLEYDSGVVSQESNDLDFINLTSELSYAESNGLEDLNGQNDLHKSKLQKFPNSSILQDDFHFSGYRESSNSWNFGNMGIEYELFPEYELNSLILNSNNSESFKYLPLTVSTSSEKNYSNGLHLKKHTFKQSKINFIHEFKRINCTSILSCVLSYLSAEDLCKASCVSKEWNEVILEDKKANIRREKFVQERKLFFTGPSKENRLGMRCVPAKEHKMAFSNLSNIDNINFFPGKPSPSMTKFDSFIKEGENGHSKLIKCPKCCYASRCQNGRIYKCTRCTYNFCSDCLGPIFKNHTCYVSKQPKTFICSKQSKKNLRRL